MTDTKVVNSGENTPEYVAYKLYRDLAAFDEAKRRQCWQLTRSA